MVMYPWSLYTIAIDFLLIPEPVGYESNKDIFVLGSDAPDLDDKQKR